jgi:hypothetical protein
VFLQIIKWVLNFNINKCTKQPGYLQVKIP